MIHRWADQERRVVMTFPGAHGYYKADEAIRPNGGDGLEHANSEALRRERDRKHEYRDEHPRFLTRLVRRLRHRT